MRRSLTCAIQQATALPAGVVEHGVSTSGLLAPFLEFAFDDCRRFLWDQDVEGEGRASELALVYAMTSKLEGGFGIPSDDVIAAETRGLNHVWFMRRLRLRLRLVQIGRRLQSGGRSL